MSRRIRSLSSRLPSAGIAVALGCGSLAAQGASPGAGLTLFSPTQGKDTYLIDGAGTVVHQWSTGFKPGLMAYLRDNGNLVRMIRTGSPAGPGPSGPGGGIQEHAWDGTLLWDWRHPRQDHLVNHDLEILPNGNLLVVSLETFPRLDVVARGRVPALATGPDWYVDYLLEIVPSGPTSGNIVWEWHAWDHLVQDFDPTKPKFGVVGSRPERIDINYPAVDIPNGDWTHGNGVDYHAAFDQIVLSVRGFSELWVIDHGTTTTEATASSGGRQGVGGDLLYRWGNPEAHGAGTSTDRTLYAQHDVNWIDPGHPGAGNLLVFNNGLGRPAGAYSSVEEIVPPVDATGSYAQPLAGSPYGPAAPVWSYTASLPQTLFSPIISGAERLPNGNTLICSGTQAWLFEVDPADNVVWQYINTFGGAGGASVFKARRYERYLFPSPDTLSAATGATIAFELVAGSAHASQGYVVAASLSGTTPGTPLPVTGTLVPLNYDALTNVVIANLNSPSFSNFAGVLDASGRATATMTVGPLDPSTIGLTANFAYALTPALDFASNAAAITIVP